MEHDSIKLEVGDEFTVGLRGRAGHRWSLVSPCSVASGRMVKWEGYGPRQFTEIWRFETWRPGTGYLRFAYRKVGDPQVLKSVMVRVHLEREGGAAQAVLEGAAAAAGHPDGCGLAVGGGGGGAVAQGHAEHPQPV